MGVGHDDLLRLRDGEPDPRLVRARPDRLSVPALGRCRAPIRRNPARARTRGGGRPGEPPHDAPLPARPVRGDRRGGHGARPRGMAGAVARVRHRGARRISPAAGHDDPLLSPGRHDPAAAPDERKRVPAPDDGRAPDRRSPGRCGDHGRIRGRGRLRGGRGLLSPRDPHRVRDLPAAPRGGTGAGSPGRLGRGPVRGRVRARAGVHPVFGGDPLRALSRRSREPPRLPEHPRPSSRGRQGRVRGG